jgi:transposase
LRRPARGGDGRQYGGARASLGGWSKRGQRRQAIGRSRRGPTTKIHALADAAGGLHAVMLTAGQVHDVHGGRALLARVPPMQRLIADKTYDANDLRAFLAAQGTEAVISPMPRRLTPPPFDAFAYRSRNLIERLLQAQGLACYRHPLRQDRPQFSRRRLPRRRRHALDALSPRPNVAPGTAPSRS